ncbi:MAG: hypothetical protein AB7G17_10480 [Phycisphaerales bacterium]
MLAGVSWQVRREWLGARERRVALLVVAVVLMGLTDLLCTLTHMRGPGMIESNPVARWFAMIGGERELVLYKLWTMALSGGLVYLMRRRWQAEAAGWVMVIVMLTLTAHWQRYNANAAVVASVADAMRDSPGWIRFDH